MNEIEMDELATDNSLSVGPKDVPLNSNPTTVESHSVLTPPVNKKHNWYKRLASTAVFVILLFSYLFCYISLEDVEEMEVFKKGIVGGFVLILLIIMFFTFQAILLLPTIQRLIHRIPYLDRVMAFFYKNYNHQTFVFKLPNLDKMIERIHNDPPVEKVNRTPINTIIHSYRSFIKTHTTTIKIFTVTLSIVAICFSLALIYLVVQQTETFRNAYIQTFIISALIISYVLICLIVQIKIVEIIVIVLHSLFYVFYKRIVVAPSIFIALSMLSVSTALFLSKVPTTSTTVLEWFHTAIYSSTFAVTMLLFTLFVVGFVLFQSRFKCSDFGKVMRKYLRSIFITHWCATLTYTTFLLLFLISAASSWCLTVMTFSKLNVPNSFNSIENTNTINIENVPVITRPLSQITFGCGIDNYYRAEYTKPTILTPTMDFSNYLQLSVTSQDYYHITSSHIPMNGVILFPSDILEEKNKTKQYRVVAILPEHLGNLVSGDIGYRYLQETFAQNDLIAISIDSTFFDKDASGNWIVVKNSNATQRERYIEVRSLLALNTLNYLETELNKYFNVTIWVEKFGLFGDRTGGSVGIKMVETLKDNVAYPLLYKNAIQKNLQVVSFSGLSIQEIINKTLFSDICSYFIEVVPSIPAYPKPFLVSYSHFPEQDINLHNETTESSENILKNEVTLLYTGALIIQRGNANNYNSEYVEEDSGILIDKIFPSTQHYMEKEELQYTVSLFVGSHFICNLNERCFNYQMLRDFKIADEVLPTTSAYFNTYKSNKDILLDSNGTLFHNVTSSTNAEFVGLFYQNAYQQLHRNMKCQTLCKYTLTLGNKISALGLKFDFFQNNASSEFNNYLYIRYNTDTIVELSKFKYVGIPQDDESTAKFKLGKLHFLQTFEFDVFENETSVYIDEITLVFVGEVLLDNVAIYN
ncbi:hypothetical protein EIN_053600 [Entamoeba invadens IP1]|uniref:hypothetical protein n=1 Tax=Entamoeba invadens IP1 TaxID=370355 RepID=UPI0002C3EFBB|nr:hypothetical protein EIN_053600 [Entamoeba invadens IP1]ELP93115.1 hypothetical protein EIN_053600 [Entamoeba invadens IP1]|eukprot:XP_004259886.1 hypothetical protein EIN_053600 [Entamoeba invadens IP1]